MIYIAVIAFKQGGYGLARISCGHVMAGPTKPFPSPSRGSDMLLLMQVVLALIWMSQCVRDYGQWVITVGHPARLSYGIDSAGNTCGQKNSWNGGQGPDLTEYKKLYYLNPLELLDTSTFLGARSVCVKQCPAAEDACGLASLPCRNDRQYR